MRKSINSLIIGAGKEQIYFIKEAKKLDINIIGLDESPIAEGLNFVDIPIVIDIKDENKVIEIAKKYNINFVLPAPIGNLITLTGAVNNALKINILFCAYFIIFLFLKSNYCVLLFLLLE